MVIEEGLDDVAPTRLLYERNKHFGGPLPQSLLRAWHRQLDSTLRSAVSAGCQQYLLHPYILVSSTLPAHYRMRRTYGGAGSHVEPLLHPKAWQSLPRFIYSGTIYREILSYSIKSCYLYQADWHAHGYDCVH